MITFSKVRLNYLNSFQTFRPLEGLVVWYDTPKKGFTRGYLMQTEVELDADGNSMYRETSVIEGGMVTFEDSQLNGQHPLDFFHDYFLAQLIALNPNVEFTNTLE